MKSVLIVEPDKFGAAELAQGLREGGFHADVVDTRDSAMRFLRGSRVSALVLSENAGFDTVLCLLRTVHGLRVPTIILGDEDSSTTTVVALNLGADCYMTKPYSPREMLARIRSLIRPFSQAI